MSKCVGWTHSGSRLKFRPSVNFQFTQCKKSRKTMTALASKGKWSHPIIPTASWVASVACPISAEFNSTFFCFSRNVQSAKEAIEACRFEFLLCSFVPTYKATLCSNINTNPPSPRGKRITTMWRVYTTCNSVTAIGKSRSKIQVLIALGTWLSVHVQPHRLHLGLFDIATKNGWTLPVLEMIYQLSIVIFSCYITRG